MSRKFIGLVTAFSIAVTGLTAAPARAASDEDIAGILAGLVILGAVAAAVNSKKRTREVTVEQPKPHRQTPRHNRRNARLLPAECLRIAWVDDTRMRYFAKRCLQRNYRHADSLPRYCRTRVETSRGRIAKGYNARCLRREGYRIARG